MEPEGGRDELTAVVEPLVPGQSLSLCPLQPLPPTCLQVCMSRLPLGPGCLLPSPWFTCVSQGVVTTPSNSISLLCTGHITWPRASVTELYQQLSPVRLRVQGCSTHSDGRSRAGQLMAGSEASGQDGPSTPLWSLPPEGDLNPVQWAYPKKPNSRQSSCKGCPLQCHSSQPEKFQTTSFPVPGYPSLPFQLSLCPFQALQGQPSPGEQALLHLITGRAWDDEPGHGLKVPRTWGVGEFILLLSLHLWYHPANTTRAAGPSYLALHGF